MCRVPRLSDQRLRFFALTVEFYAYDDQLPSPPVGLGRAREPCERAVGRSPRVPAARSHVIPNQNQIYYSNDTVLPY